jgi:hypothetical protein
MHASQLPLCPASPAPAKPLIGPPEHPGPLLREIQLRLQHPPQKQTQLTPRTCFSYLPHQVQIHMHIPFTQVQRKGSTDSFS